MISLRLPKIFFIKGVFKRDCQTDDLLEKKVTDVVENSEFQISEMTNVNGMRELNFGEWDKSCNKLPCVFESLEQWPKKTSLLCWHCSLPFNSMPIFIPKVIEPIISKNKYNKHFIGVYGVFCSFGDAMEFINKSNWCLVDKIEAGNKLRHLHKMFFDVPMKEIVSYPQVHDMIQYGGNTDINQYRKLIDNFKTQEEIDILNKL